MRLYYKLSFLSVAVEKYCQCEWDKGKIVITFPLKFQNWHSSWIISHSSVCFQERTVFLVSFHETFSSVLGSCEKNCVGDLTGWEGSVCGWTFSEIPTWTMERHTPQDGTGSSVGKWESHTPHTATTTAGHTD